MRLSKRAVFLYVLLMAIALLVSGGAISKAFYATDYDFFIWLIVALFVWNCISSIVIYHNVRELNISRHRVSSLENEVDEERMSSFEMRTLLKENGKLKSKLKKLKHSKKRGKS